MGIAEGRNADFEKTLKADSAAAAGFQAWDAWLNEGIRRMSQSDLLRSLRPIHVDPLPDSDGHSLVSNSGEEGGNIGAPFHGSFSREEEPNAGGEQEVHDEVDHLLNRLKFYDARGPWDYAAVNVKVNAATMDAWQNDLHSTGQDATNDSMRHENRIQLFSGNDYLGLSFHPSIRSMSSYASLKYGMGLRSSPLVCGYTSFHRKLETILAKLKETEECVLTPSGFSANLAVISALTLSHHSLTASSKSDPIDSELDLVTVFSDELNHASIIDGLKIASRNKNVAVKVYKHNDTRDLETQLKRCKTLRKIVVTDSLFSMDGDFAPMVEISRLRSIYGFLWIIDEAHATLVCGKNGSGAAEHFDVKHDVDIQVGTLSKAIGSQGGFVACSKKFKQWIISRGRSFIYSTALPLPVVFSAMAAIKIAELESWRQAELWNNIHLFSKILNMNFTSPIIPIVIGNSKRALELSKMLLQNGFHVPAIRPPTVPPNSSRLRIALSASHTSQDVQTVARLVLMAMENIPSLPMVPPPTHSSQHNTIQNHRSHSDERDLPKLRPKM